ncbi:MAG: GNAT family N-acetyltransferase [Proteobacteria bacterium]|nr:GNAT family N-acetyltransferase [Pseudomonadota bacterium]
MNDKRFRVIPINQTQDRSTFNCGSEPLDSYFQERLTQDIRRRVTACFIARTNDDRIAGYYTLASASVFLGDLPEKFKKKLPRYPSVPVVRMGRLAVDQTYKGLGLGAALLADALTRVVRSEIAAYALLVDAKDNTAADFYRHHGFIQTARELLTLFLPLATAPVT